MPKGMLHGVKVVDFSALLPGPFATGILADLGAEVIKVEPPVGDFTRRMPARIFAMANRNKRSLVLDLKHPGAAAIVRRLAAWGDVAIEGFRPGVAERIGIGPKRMRELNPKLVYCSISGYGQSGPLRDVPGHDFNYLAASGSLSLLGHWNDKEGRRSGLPVADLAGASYAVISILSALMQRERTGVGCAIDVSLTDAMMSFTAVRAGLDVDEGGRWHLYPTNDVFTTKDGRRIALGVVEPHFWDAYLAVAGPLEPRLRDPRYATEESRREHGDELSAVMADVMATRSASEWFALFEGTDVPSQLVHTPREAATMPHTRQRGVVVSKDGTSHIPFPVLVDERPAGALESSAPALGQHSIEVLRMLALAEGDAAALVKDGACAPSVAGTQPA